MTRLSDLDLVILGILAKFGPQTPYAVRQHFEGSPTRSFSSSTGSIYPALRRLERDTLVDRRDDAKGLQARSIYSVTKSGRARLADWLTPPLDDEDLAVPFDPIRTRLYFLTCLTPRERKRFLDETIAALEARLPHVRAYLATYAAEGERGSEGRLGYLATKGILVSARAQLRWLREVRDG